MTIPALTEIPLGPDTVEYRPGGQDLEATGPHLVAITSTGAINVADPVAGRILVIEDDATRFVDLFAMDILNVTAMTADGEDLLLVEVFFAPLRQRLHRLGPDGELLDSFDLPAGYRLEDGLSDILAGDGEVAVIEFAGGGFYARYDPTTASIADDPPPIDVRGVAVEPQAPDLTIDGVLITADLSGALGGLRYLGTATDGSHIIERSDVLEVAPVIKVLRTVEWYAADGTFVGSARVPGIEQQAIGEAPGLAVTEDGRVFVLVALDDRIEVRQLEREPGRILD